MDSTWNCEVIYSTAYTTILLYFVNDCSVAKQTIYHSDVFGNSHTLQIID